MPPAYSPLSFGAIAAAVRDAMRADPRPRLTSSLQATFGADETVLTASGTQGLALAVRMALGKLGEDVPVSLPAYSCFDVAAAAVAAGAGIVLYDLDPGTLAPDPVSLGRAIDSGGRVIVVAPLYGVPVDWDGIRDLASRHDAVVIEDAAQGQGATWNGRALGSLGDMSVLSFGRGKGWTGGAGGALLLRSDWAHEPRPRLRQSRHSSGVRAAAAASAQWALARPRSYAVPAAVPWLRLGETIYHEPGPAEGIDRFASALLLRTRGAAAAEAEHRATVSARYSDALESCRGLLTIRVPARGVPGYLRFPVRVPGGMAALGDAGTAARLGIAPGYPKTLADLSPVQKRLHRPSRCPGAEALVRELVTFPSHSRTPPHWPGHLLRWLHTRLGA